MKLSRLVLFAVTFFCSFLAMAPPAVAQTPLEYKALFDTEGRSVIVSSVRVGQLTNFVSKGFTLDASALGGVDAFGIPVVGMAFTSKVRLADQLSLEVGPAYRVLQSQRPRFGLFLGFTLKQ